MLKRKNCLAARTAVVIVTLANKTENKLHTAALHPSRKFNKLHYLAITFVLVQRHRRNEEGTRHHTTSPPSCPATIPVTGCSPRAQMRTISTHLPNLRRRPPGASASNKTCSSRISCIFLVVTAAACVWSGGVTVTKYVAMGLLSTGHHCRSGEDRSHRPVACVPCFRQGSKPKPKLLRSTAVGGSFLSTINYNNIPPFCMESNVSRRYKPRIIGTRLPQNIIFLQIHEYLGVNDLRKSEKALENLLPLILGSSERL